MGIVHKYPQIDNEVVIGLEDTSASSSQNPASKRSKQLPPETPLGEQRKETAAEAHSLGTDWRRQENKRLRNLILPKTWVLLEQVVLLWDRTRHSPRARVEELELVHVNHLLGKEEHR